MKTIDTHAHLDHLPNLDQALENAYQSGVEGIVCVSMDVKSCLLNLEIKRKKFKSKIYLAMGMHPSEADLVELDTILQMIKSNAAELSAVGEIGLDFWYKWVKKDDAKKDEQRQVFRRHLELAKQLKLPVIIHSRGAWRECLETVQEIGLKKAVFHWYSGPLDVLADIMSSGFYVSASPSLAYSPQSREAISHANINQVLIETDCPVFYRISDQEGFQAEPKDVFRTLEAYCGLKNMDPAEAVLIFNRNAQNFFNI